MKPLSAEGVQWLNIKTVVKQLADHCFGSKDDPRWGTAWISVVTSLTAKDGPTFTLEPLPESNKVADLSAEILSLKEKIKQLEAQKFAKFNDDECWIYQGHDDHLESLVCPVVIGAADLNDILAQNASLKEANRKIFTNGDRTLTLDNRFFTVSDDGFISDQNFDFDAGMSVTGDFVGDEKVQYARMIADALNSHLDIVNESDRVLQNARTLATANHDNQVELEGRFDELSEIVTEQLIPVVRALSPEVANRTVFVNLCEKVNELTRSKD